MNGGDTITYTERLPDKDAYVHLYEITGWNEYMRATADELWRAATMSLFMITAYHEGRLVGMGRVSSDGAIHALIQDVIVSPGYRKQGIATEVLNRLVEKCRNMRIRQVQLFAAPGKENFYLKRGFSHRPETAPGLEINLYKEYR